MFKKIQHIYFVGIGGSGMCGIAQVLLNLGYRVSGSDVKDSETVEHLRTLGATVNLSHCEENVADIDVLVVSSAIKKDNPEVCASHNRNIPVIPRAEMLAELMRLKYGIAVAGTHGKTTTTSMIAKILADMDPTVVIGGRLDTPGSNAHLGKGDFLVAEADESDGSFLKLSPTISVVTTVDEDHLDYYANLEHIQKVFLEFMNKVPFYGVTVFCMDQENIRPLIPLLERRSITYGIQGQADFMANNIHMHENTVSYDLIKHGEKLCPIKLSVPGTHNLYNSLAACAVALELETPIPVIQKALALFSGVKRRFEMLGDVNSIKVVDDYAHHPTEIKATLKAAKRGWNSRTMVIFQPHRYSRTKDLMQQFATSFYEADVLFIVDVFPAGESPISGVNSALLSEEIKKYGHKNVHYTPDNAALIERVLLEACDGDMILTLGAGSVGKLSKEILKRLQESRSTKAGL